MDPITEVPKIGDTTARPADLGTLRGLPGERVNLGTLVRVGVGQIPESPVVLDQITQGMNTTPEQEVEAIETWLKLKPERNALTAIFISDIWSRLDTFKNTMRNGGSDLGVGLRTWDDLENRYVLKPFDSSQIKEPIKDLRAATRHSFEQISRDWEQEMQNRRRSDPSPEQIPMNKAYARLSHIIYFGSHNQLANNDSVSHFIERGIGTAVDTMWGIMEVIPRVYEIQNGRTITKTELEQIATNSLSLVMHLAAGNLEIAVPLLKYLANGSNDNFFDPQFFTLTTERGKTSLRITEHALQTVRMGDGNLLADYVNISETTGCPAIQARGEKKNVIAEMWEWTLDLARQAYFPTFSNT